MKFRTALTLAALAGLMSLPFGAYAQSRGHGFQGGSFQDRGGAPSRGSQDRNGARAGNEGTRTAPNQTWRGSGFDRTADLGRTQNRGNERTEPAGSWQRGSADRRQTPDRQSHPSQFNGAREPQQWQRGDHGDSNAHRDNWRSGNFDTRRDFDRNHRFFRTDHDDWRDIAFSMGLGVDLNFFSNDDRICFDGYSGAPYPIWQYDEDLNSPDPNLRARAEFFSHDCFYRNGHRYERRVVSSYGDRCYEFVRVD